MSSQDAENAERAVRALLRPSEAITAFLVARSERVDDLNAFVASDGGAEDNRVLAVIQNQDGLGG
jgi:hypothetical protein